MKQRWLIYWHVKHEVAQPVHMRSGRYLTAERYDNSTGALYEFWSLGIAEITSRVVTMYLRTVEVEHVTPCPHHLEESYERHDD
ncbi:MAG TPA: hypothetical protein VF708_19895 [Pyrinomonadaceae bacterium]|jgi:hypothetical protein